MQLSFKSKIRAFSKNSTCLGSISVQIISKGGWLWRFALFYNNPVKAGIVDRPECYVYSSARDYFDIEKGLLGVCYKLLLITGTEVTSAPKYA